MRVECKMMKELHQSITVLFKIVCLCMLLLSANSFASGVRFQANWQALDGSRGVSSCHDSGKVCVDSGEKTIQGLKVSKPCWRYTYTKTCNFPSKNDCHLIAHCYEIGLKECLLKDAYGNCVNQRKEFSCKRREVDFLDHQRVKQKLTGDEATRIVCKGIPCMDGNCIDKSYDMDADMMKSTSQLYAASQTKGAKDMNFQLFQGFGQHCSKKAAGYLNCCKIKGWGGELGAKCNADERKLQDLRSKNLCVYVGKSTSGTKPVHVNKHHFCCFGNMLNKVFQVEARKQLGINFGSGGSANCRGLTLEEILRLDFEKMDLSEFVNEIKGRMKVPNVGDIESRVKGSLPSIKEYDRSTPHPESNPDIKNGGVSNKVQSTLGDEGDYGK